MNCIFEVVDQIHVLEFPIGADLIWRSNTSDIWKKAVGAAIKLLQFRYDKQIRSMFEFLARVWTYKLMLAKIKQIEQVHTDEGNTLSAEILILEDENQVFF